MSVAQRFYKRAEASQTETGFGVTLDARALKTPKGRPFATPTRELAEMIAGEWQAQEASIVPATMPLTQLAFAAIDITPDRRDELSSSLAKYIETDLTCHRAEGPAPLVARQAAAWDPIVAWAQTRFHVRLPVVTGVIAAEISPQVSTMFEWEIDDLDNFRCTALAQAATLSGSLLIGFALLEGQLDGAGAYAAATLDEQWSFENWGEDAEARARLDRLRDDLNTVGRFITALG